MCGLVSKDAASNICHARGVGYGWPNIVRFCCFQGFAFYAFFVVQYGHESKE